MPGHSPLTTYHLPLTLKLKKVFQKAQRFSVFLSIFLLAATFFFFSPTTAFAGTITSISYGPSGSVVGTHVQASDDDFVIFTPITALDSVLANTITLTFPSGTTLTSANITTSDFIIRQAAQGACTNQGSDNINPAAISVNEANRTITFTVASDSLSKTLSLVECGLGEITIRTSSTASGNEIQHPTTTTTTGAFQVETIDGTDTGSINTVSFDPDSANKLSFSTQPSSTAVVETDLTTQPAVAVQDQYGNTITGSSALITLTAVLASDGTTAGSGTLNVTTNPLSATSGIAVFSGINYTVAESIKLKATASGLTQALSNTITVSDLTISNVSASTTPSGATITWSTNGASSSKVDYGLTNSYGNSTTETDTSSRVTSHSVALSDLIDCTTYHYRVQSTTAGGNETIDSDNTFITTGCTGSASVISQTASTITTASGGSVALTSGGTATTLTVPDSFAASDANFQIKQLDKTPVINTTSTPTGYSSIGSHIYDFSALSAVRTPISTFANALTTSIAYTSSEVLDIDESTLRIYRWDGSNWNQLSNCSVDTSAKTVSCTTTTFSVFGLFGQASSSSGTSSSSSTSSSISAPACEDPSPGAKAPWLYGAIAQDDNSVLLYFTEADEPVDKYALKFGTKSGEYPWGSTNIGGKGTRTYLVQSLFPNTTYYFKVRGSNGCATGPWSNEISTSTKSRLTIRSLDITESTLEPVSCTSSYKIKEGDTLWTISQKLLGSGANYNKIIRANPSLGENTILQIGQEITIPCQALNERDDTSQSSKEEKQGYQLTVKVADKKGQAVAGAKVTLHSTVQEKVTDKDGIVVFSDVEKGDHRLIIAYKNYQGEQSINLQGDVKEFKLEVTVVPANALLTKPVLILFGILCAIIIFLLFRLRKKR